MVFLLLLFIERTNYILNFYRSEGSKEASLFLNITLNSKGTFCLFYEHKSTYLAVLFWVFLRGSETLNPLFFSSRKLVALSRGVHTRTCSVLFPYLNSKNSSSQKNIQCGFGFSYKSFHLALLSLGYFQYTLHNQLIRNWSKRLWLWPPVFTSPFFSSWVFETWFVRLSNWFLSAVVKFDCVHVIGLGTTQDQDELASRCIVDLQLWVWYLAPTFPHSLFSCSDSCHEVSSFSPPFPSTMPFLPWSQPTK